MKISSMIVSGIIGFVLSGCALPGVRSLTPESLADRVPRDITTNDRMRVLGQRIRTYYGLHGTLPDDLRSLPATPNRDVEFVDGWGRPIQYFKDGDKQCRLVSLGADGKIGGHEMNADNIQQMDFSE